MINSEEKMIYQILFNIRYNNKFFTVFIDKYNRRTFLEIDKNGKYIYPFIDDFIQLHRIYNERDIFTVYESKKNYPIYNQLPIHSETKVTFKEFVRVSIGALALSVSLLTGTSLMLGIMTGRMFKLVQNDTNLEIVMEYVDGTLINNTSELDNILGYPSVSKEEIINVINSNENIPEDYKKYPIILLEYITNKYPNTDSRIFYENMKNLKVLEVPPEEIRKYANGTFSPVDTEIRILNDSADSSETKTHEFVHSYHYWKEKSLIFPKYRVETIGYALDEAMTNKITNGIIPTTGYVQNGRILDYFLSCVDYDYYDYEREGISKLIKLLTEKYPNVDINYIITLMDSIHDTTFSIGQTIKIEENAYALDELFNICIQNININASDVYIPFKNFIKATDYNNNKNLVDSYLKRYNDILVNNKYDANRIIDNSEKFITTLNYGNKIKKTFRKYISTLKINEFPQYQIYQPFKSFIDSSIDFTYYSSIEDVENICSELLNMYNDLLYCNGYQLSDTITSENVISNYQKYRDIKIRGYIITNEDKLYPLVETENGKAEPIDENFKLIENAERRASANAPSEINSYRFKVITTAFKNLDVSTMVWNEQYWQQIFDLNPIYYKQTPIYNNGKLIAEEYLPHITISIEQKTNEELTFLLGNGKQVIYQSDANVKGISLPFETYLTKYLEQYLSLGNTIEKIELSEILNEDYIKTMVAGEKLTNSVNPLYSNITYDIENDSLQFHPAYSIIINEQGMKNLLNKVCLYLDPNKSVLELPKESLEFTLPDISSVVPNTKIYLETVLKHFGMLSEEEQNYYLTKDEIIELYNNYIIDVYNKTNNKNR